MKIVSALIVCLIFNGGLSVARAQIIYTDLEFGTAYFQADTPSQPFPVIAGTVWTQSAGGTTAVSLTTPGGVSINLPLQSAGTWFGLSTMGSVNGTYPDGTYTFTAAGGTLGTKSVSVKATESFPATQLFTGNTLLDLETDSVSAPISISFSQFVADPKADQSYLTLAVRGLDITGAFGAELPTSSTGYTFAANTFAPGTTYEMQIQAYNYYAANDFINTPGIGYATTTYLEFTTAAPEPAGYWYGVLMLLITGIMTRARSTKRR